MKDMARFDLAERVVKGEGVKLNRFLPSGMTLWTVVGRVCEYFVVCNLPKPFCSCDDFHYRVLGGKVAECYHLLAAKRAVEEGKYMIFEYRDEEFQIFVRTILSGIFANIS